MEKNRKELMTFSIVILVLAAFTLVKLIVNACVNGLPQITEIPEGFTKEAVQVITIIAYVLSFLTLLPQIYIGV